MGDNSTIGLLTNINNSLGKIVEAMLPQNKDAKKDQAETVKNLSQGGLSSGANAAKAAEPSAKDMSGLNVAQLVSSLDGLPEQVKLIAKLSGKTIKNFEEVITVIVNVFSQDAFKSLDKKSEMGANLLKTLTELGKLPDALKDVSKIKEKDVEKFAKVITTLTEKVLKAIQNSKVSDKDIQLAKKISETISALTTAVKSLAKMTLIAPLAMVGLLAMIPVWLTFSAVLMLIGLLEKPIQKGLNALKGVDQFMTKMLKTALLGIVVAGSVILLGLVLKKNIDLMLYGLAGLMAVFLAIGVIAILGGLIGLLIKSSNIFDKQIIKFTLELMLIAGLTIVLGMLLQVGWKQALIGLGGMIVIMTAMIGIALLIRLVGEISMDSIKAMAGVMLLMLASMAVAALSVLLGQYLEQNWDYALLGFSATMAILGAVLGLTYLAKQVGKEAKAGVKNLFLAEGVILGAMAIVWATIKTGELVWDYFGTDTGTAIAKVAIISAVTAAIILGAWEITKIANRASKDIKKGAIALLLAEGVILASAVVALAVIGVTKVMETVEPDALTNTLLTMATIVGAAGVVAVIASKFHSSIMKGALVMVALEALVLGMVGVMYALVMTAKAATEIGWANVFITVGSMIALLGLFVGLTAAFALLCNPYTLIALAAGGAVMLSISLLILAVTGTTMAVIKLAEMMDKSGKTTEELGELLHSITHDVFSYKNLDPQVSVLQAAKLSAKYLLLMPALLGIMAVVTVVSDMAKKFGGLSEMRGDDYYISPYYGMNGNQPVFGEPVNIPKIAENIVQAITIFSNRLFEGFEGFENVDLTRLVAVGITMRNLIEPVSQFAQMVSGFKEGTGPGYLKPVFISNNGDIRYGESINVVEVATSIAGAIGAFASTLYGDGEEAPQWLFFMRKKKYRNRLENAMNTFAAIIDPINNFMDLMLGYQSEGPGMLKKATFDEQGNYRDNGAPAINVVDVASSIATTIKVFAETLFGDGAEWMSVFKKQSRTDRINTAMSTLGSVIAPIQSFIEAISAIEAQGGEMYYVWVDEKGGIQRKKINLKASSMAIAGAVSVFVKTLFSKETTDAWTNMINVANGGKQLVAGNNNDKSPFSVFGEILDPIVNFTKVIAEIGADTQDGKLVIPIYDSNGNKVGERIVDLYNTAEIIAKAVTTFVSILFSDANKNTWMSLLYNTNTNGTINYSSESKLKDSIGVFAAVIDPVAKFAETISMFGGTADDFRIYDGENVRKINLIEVANAIAMAVTSFMTTLKPAFSDLQISIDEKNKITDFAGVVGSILENFAKIGETKKEQIDTANLVIDGYTNTIQKITEILKVLPEPAKMTDLDNIMHQSITLFSIFKDVKFDELNYKEGFEQLTFVFTQCADIAEIITRVEPTAFDVVDRFITAAKALDEFYSNYKSFDTYAVNKYIFTIADISFMYDDIPLISDTEENRKKLWFVKPFIAAAKLIKEVISVDATFAVNAKAMLDFITGMGNSMLALGATPATDLNEVSKAYAVLLERVIKLSDKRNVKSITAMNAAIKEATTRMAKFDDRLIKHANDRKKKLDELVKTVGDLNEKLEKTAKSMEEIAEDLEKISEFDENTIKKNINAANGSSTTSIGSAASDLISHITSGGSKSSNNAPTTTITVDDIQQAITDALKSLQVNNGTYTITLPEPLLTAICGNNINGSNVIGNGNITISSRTASIEDKVS